MRFSSSFRFVNDKLNDKLIRLIKRTSIKHRMDENDVLYYSPSQSESVEEDLICSIRTQAFPSWQVLTCPPNWTSLYRIYMAHNGVPFYEELINNKVWFLIPRKHRPHLWKLTTKETRPHIIASERGIGAKS